MSYLNQIRPVLFLFYMVEIVINIILMQFYLITLAAIQDTVVMDTKRLSYFSYLVLFYLFTIWTMFACVNVCTKNTPSILEEVLRPLVAFIAYTILTILALYDAESDFPLLFPKTTDKNLLQPEDPLPNYFKLLRDQATASLACSVFYLLHTLIALDVLLSNEDEDTTDERWSELSLDMVEREYQPVRLYALGSYMQRWLESFQWFRDYISDGIMDV